MSPNNVAENLNTFVRQEDVTVGDVSLIVKMVGNLALLALGQGQMNPSSNFKKVWLVVSLF